MSDGARGGRGFLAALFAAAFAARIAALLAVGTHRLAEGADAWTWGHEAASLARSILERGAYGDPWGTPTGPSSWLTPVYPAFLALLMTLFGGIGPAFAFAVFAIHSLVSAATCLVLVALGRELGNPRAGKLAGWAFALYPIAIANAVQLVWDTTFVAALLAWTFLAFLRVRGDSRSAVRAGFAYGALLCLNPAPIGMAPAIAAFLWTRGRLRAVAIAFGVAFLACLPWLLRNQLVLGAFSMRPNFGVELRIGNHDEANGRPQPFLYHPSHIEDERRLYRELGEVAYARENVDRALAWIRTHPARFAELTLRRAALFWVSEPPTVDPRRDERGRSPARDPASWLKYVVYALTGAAGLAGLALGPWPRATRLLLAGSPLLFGAPYYLSHVSERYRFPVDPLLVLGTAAIALSIVDRMLQARRKTLDAST